MNPPSQGTRADGTLSGDKLPAPNLPAPALRAPELAGRVPTVATNRPAAPADVTLPGGSSTGAVRHLVGLLARPTLADRGAWALPVAATAVSSALALLVAGGVHWFWLLPGTLAGLYKMLSAVALVLLVLPLATLAAAAARLSATRRDERLSSLRLLGATRATLRLLTLVETAGTAAVGALVGVVGYAALMPLLGLLRFGGNRIGATGLWLGALPVAGMVLALVLLAVVSSAIGLRRVEISPLGVRTRQQAPSASRWRIIGGVALVAGASLAARFVGGSASTAAAVALLLVMLALPLLALNLAGPWVLARQAAVDHRRAHTATALLAARTVLEDPKQAWRQVGALGLVTFVAVFSGVGLAISAKTSNQGEAQVLADLRTGVLLTLAISFVTVACSLAVNQTAAVLDRRRLHVGLDMLGMDWRMADAARRRAVMRPLLTVVLGAAACALALVLPLGAVNRLTNPVAILTVVAVLVAGLGCVLAALAASRVALRRVVTAGLARAE